MEESLQQIIAQSRIVYTFNNFFFHQFVKSTKNKVAEGNCLVLEHGTPDEAGATTYLKMNNSNVCKRVNSSLFVRKTYQKSTSYLFFHDVNLQVVYSISLLNNSADLIVMHQLLVKYGTVIDYESPSLQYNSKIRIDFHCENIKENEIIVHFNKTTKMVKSIGIFFGYINRMIQGKAQWAEQAYQQKISKIGRQSFSEQTKSKWSSFKQKASNLNSTLAEVIQPINQKIKVIADSIGDKYNNSENQYVKSLRILAHETQDSLNDGYGVAESWKPEQPKEEYTEPNETYAKISGSSEVVLDVIQETKPKKDSFDD